MNIPLKLPETFPNRYVAAEWRPPKEGEEFLCEDGSVDSANYDFSDDELCLVLIRASYPEELLGIKCAGIARDADGDWYAFDDQPYMEDDRWLVDGEVYFNLGPRWFPLLDRFDNLHWTQTWLPHPDA